MICFELIFVYGTRCGLKFKLLDMNIQLFWYHLLKGLLCLNWITFVPLLKIGHLYTCGSIAGPYSILLIYLCILMPHCLYYCGFMNLGIKFCKSFNFVLLFHSYFDSSRSFSFAYEFWNQLVNVYNKACWKCKIYIYIYKAWEWVDYHYELLI